MNSGWPSGADARTFSIAGTSYIQWMGWAGGGEGWRGVERHHYVLSTYGSAVGIRGRLSHMLYVSMYGGTVEVMHMAQIHMYLMISELHPCKSLSQQ